MSAPVKKCEVTPLEALRRLYDVARKVDASESGDFETLLQGELVVAESVLRDSAAPLRPFVKCEECDGKGSVVTDEGYPGDGFMQPSDGPTIEACPVCEGRGEHNLAPISQAAPVVPVAAQPVVQQEPIGWVLSTPLHDHFEPGKFSAWAPGSGAVPVYAAPSLEAQPAGEASAPNAALVAALKNLMHLADEFGIQSGVCVCGDGMKYHANPMDSGHSPVDSGEYYTTGAIEEARKVLSAAGQEVKS